MPKEKGEGPRGTATPNSNVQATRGIWQTWSRFPRARLKLNQINIHNSPTPISVSHRAKAAVCEDVRSGDEAGVVREEEEGDLKSDREGAARTANRCYTQLYRQGRQGGDSPWRCRRAARAGPAPQRCPARRGRVARGARMARLARGEASLSLSGWGRALLLLLRTHSSLRGSHRTVP